MKRKLTRISSFVDFNNTLRFQSGDLFLEQENPINPVNLANRLEKSVKGIGTNEDLLLKTFLEIPNLKTLEDINRIFAKFPTSYSYKSVGSLVNAELGFFDQKTIDAIKNYMTHLKVTNNFLQKSEEFHLKEEKIKQIAEQSIKMHEGEKDKIYLDSRKNQTIGIGMNLQRSDADARLKSVGANPRLIRAGKEKLSSAQIQTLFKQDSETAFVVAKSLVPNFDEHPLPVQCVLIEMAFNLGKSGLSEFKLFLEHIKNKNYGLAAKEMLNSDWAKQVKNRANELAKRIEAYDTKNTQQ